MGPVQVSLPTAGRLQHFVDTWQGLTSDKTILEFIKGVKIQFNCNPPSNYFMSEINCSDTESEAIDSEINTYLRKGIILEVIHCTGEFVSQIFPRSKKNGGVRIILNLKHLNQFVEYEHFKMENLNTVLGLIEKNCLMASIDLEDAYYSVNVNENDRKYLRFIWKSKLYEFTCLPNGLTSAPRIFTKILKPLFSNLRRKGFMSVYYLDDSLLIGNSYTECLDNVNETKNLLVNSGFIINEKKSSLIPSTEITFLGFILNSIEMKISLPELKKRRIKDFCEDLLNQKVVKIRQLAEFIGVIVSSLPAVENGALFYRFLEHNKTNALINSRGNFESWTTLGVESKSEILWWSKNIDSAYKNIRISPPKIVITTDSSTLGWGAVFGDKTTGGLWGKSEQAFHINVLELKAVLLGLQSLLYDYQDTHIRIKSDNVTTVSYINNKGGVKSMDCHRVAVDIWTWAISRRIILTATHLPGSQNVLADKASRIFDLNTEWELNSEVYENIQNNFGSFEIDLFASRINAKHKTYASWKPDPGAAIVDSFNADWKMFYFYAFPPFSMIMKALVKMKEDRASGVLICPLWPTQPWYPKLMRMLTCVPLLLPLNVISLPFSRKTTHKQHKTLRLIACQLSGNSSHAEDFRKSLSQSCVHRGQIPHLSNTKCILESGYITVVNGVLIPYRMMKSKS